MSERTSDLYRLEAAVLTAWLFLLYAAGACRTVYVGDSGELLTAIHTLGIPHPTGYPLYVLLGKIWSLAVPFGSVAYRMSLFSAAAAAAASGLLYYLGRREGLHPVASAFAALVLAAAPSFWGEANVQRVYSLNALFVIAAAFAAFSWHRSGDRRWLLLAFFLCGLGASNHAFMAIFGFALAVSVLACEPRLRTARFFLPAAASFAIGILPYLYLPLRSAANPVLDWGNPETLSGFLGVVSRKDYWDQAWLATPLDAARVAADYLVSLGEELVWAGALLALGGAFALRHRRFRLLFPALVMLGNVLAVGLHGSRSDIFIWHRYYIPSYVMAALLAGFGCHELLARLPRRLRFLPLAVPLWGLIAGWDDFDRSRYAVAEDFGRKLLASLPPGAHLAASGDDVLFPLLYLRFVEAVRPDVHLILQGVSEADRPPLHFNPDEDALYFSHHPNWKEAGLEIVPAGVTFRAIRSGAEPPPARVPAGALAGELDPRVPKDYLTRNLIGHYHYMVGSTYAGLDWARAMVEFERAAEAAPEDEVLFYNLGLLYARSGLFTEAFEAFHRSHTIDPRGPGGKVSSAAERRSAVRQELERLAEIEIALSGELPPRGTLERHERLAEVMMERGERLAARGHRIRALRLRRSSAAVVTPDGAKE